MSVLPSERASEYPGAVPASLISDTIKDVQLYSEAETFRVRHVHLELEVLFDRKVLRGSATLSFDTLQQHVGPTLVLDTRDLSIDKVEISSDEQHFAVSSFELGET